MGKKTSETAHIVISKSLHRDLAQYSQQNGLKMQFVSEAAVRLYLQQKGGTAA